MIRLSRRRLLASGLTVAGGIAGWRLAGDSTLLAPDHHGIYGVGENLTYAAHRLLTMRQPLAREFTRRDISRVAPVNGDPPGTDAYQRLLDGGFADWRLTVGGLVARPQSLSLPEIMRLPPRSQITLHVCEEGWSFIAEWTGVALSDVLARAGVSRSARYVVFYPFDQWWDSLDMADAWHPQTLLAYGMNGRPLPPGHGAPLRLRVARQLGYKSIKYLSRIRVVDTLEGIGEGLGSASPEAGYAWYAGI
jgi:DMSO/TMAO reductase YedYZ molybdopterin-dependent catalytic subunit